MNLFYMLSGFPGIEILIALIALVFGYLIRGRLYQVNSNDNEALELRNEISQLEEDLASCKQRNSDYKKEIQALEAKLNRLIALSQTGVSEASDLKTQVVADGEPSQGIEAKEVDDNKIIAEPISEEPTTKRTNKFEALKTDNLQIIEGIGPKMESVLKENDISNWKVLGEQSNDQLREILEKYGNKYKIIDPESWPDQASLAANESWSQLVRMQKGLDVGRGFADADTPAKVEKVMIKLGIIKEYKQDDLKAIEGIGPKIAELLNSSGINSWKQLAETEVTALQNILDKAGKRYQLADPGSWPKQAALADQGRFDELTDYQEALQGGK